MIKQPISFGNLVFSKVIYMGESQLICNVCLIAHISVGW